MTNFNSLLKAAITFIELAIALVLVLLAILSLGYLASLLFRLFQTHIFLDPKEIHDLLDAALVLFLVIELFRIALAYVAGSRVLTTVIEAAFVAVARKIVLFEFSDYSGVNGFLAAAALAIMLLGLAAAHLTTQTKHLQKEQS